MACPQEISQTESFLFDNSPKFVLITPVFTNELTEIQIWKPLRFKFAMPCYECITYYCFFNLFNQHLPTTYKLWDLLKFGCQCRYRDKQGRKEVQHAVVLVPVGKKVQHLILNKKNQPGKKWVTRLICFPLFECWHLKNNNLSYFPTFIF